MWEAASVRDPLHSFLRSRSMRLNKLPLPENHSLRLLFA